MYHELELIGPDPDGAPSGWSVDLKREDSDVVGNVLRKTSTSFVARIGGDATGWSKGRYRFVNNTIITTTGSGAVFRLFDELESVEMHNNVIVTNGTGGPNVMRAQRGRVHVGERRQHRRIEQLGDDRRDERSRRSGRERSAARRPGSPT